jgi:hypothetical protein
MPRIDRVISSVGMEIGLGVAPYRSARSSDSFNSSDKVVW